MGPRSDDRGNAHGPFAPAAPMLELQWGRDQMIAEMVQFGEPVHWAMAASMGPRSDDRGNRGRLSRQLSYWTASMGPRSDDRGNCEAVRWTEGRLGASMGPRSDDR